MHQKMHNLKTGIIILLALVASAWTRSDASVAVYPQTLFINAPNRSVAITVSNPTETRQEIWVDFRYGYPLVNDSGKFYINYSDSTSLQEPNAVPWLTAYPQRFVLEARESQVVRVMAQLPVGVAAGEYWSRVVVSSRQRTATPPQTPGANVRMKMEFITQVDVPLQVRTGSVSTGLKIQGITSVVDSGKLKMGVDVTRMGNASFWGTMHFFLRDRDGRVMKKYDQHVAVFRDVVYPVTIDVAGIAPGAYVLEVDVDNVRPGVPPQYRLKADAVRFTYQLTIP
jgi:P pilus assembly chaperone PapD